MKRGKTKKVFFLEKNSPFEEEEKNQKNQKKRSSCHLLSKIIIRFNKILNDLNIII